MAPKSETTPIRPIIASSSIASFSGYYYFWLLWFPIFQLAILDPHKNCFTPSLVHHKFIGH